PGGYPGGHPRTIRVLALGFLPDRPGSGPADHPRLCRPHDDDHRPRTHLPAHRGRARRHGPDPRVLRWQDRCAARAGHHTAPARRRLTRTETTLTETTTTECGWTSCRSW